MALRRLTGHLSDAGKAGLEGALLAAGLLGAVIEPDGALRAATGELLLSPGDAPPGPPLSVALGPTWPPGCPPRPSLRSWAASASTTPVPRRWCRGRQLAQRPLRGRHVPGRARHIGAAARAAHRRERIGQIDAELAELAREAGLREQRRAELSAVTSLANALVRAAPRTADLYAARRVAAEAMARADRSAAHATQEAERARQLRGMWAADMSTHQATCAHHGLPVEAEALEGTVTAARRAQKRARS